ncbi:hypothetical protein [Winogradskyella vidalii]|uniref:hypothetical protein n=1 Tax=Winogradskyella vidalii TaxID=2615024 RepID=UPI0015C7BFF6|nr:hypothetical protein [Winogradskyella vidalii]
MTGQAIGKLNHFLALKDNTDFLVFGNSRANRHINVDLFSKNSFNMGVDCVDIAYNSTLINTLPETKKQLILVHIDTKNFFDINYDGADIRGLKTKYQRDNKITKALHKSKQLSVFQRFYYSINYNGSAIGIIKNYFKPSYNYKAYNGYDPIPVNESNKETRDLTLSKSIHINTECTDNHTINPIALDYLKTIKNFVEKSPDKTFLFVTSPMYNDNCNTDNIKLSNLMQELGLNYWDFTNLYKNTNNNSYWKDATHMSKKGVEAFSKHLLEKFKTSNI